MLAISEDSLDSKIEIFARVQSFYMPASFFP